MGLTITKDGATHYVQLDMQFPIAAGENKVACYPYGWESKTDYDDSRIVMQVEPQKLGSPQPTVASVPGLPRDFMLKISDAPADFAGDNLADKFINWANDEFKKHLILEHGYSEEDFS